jgi:hypothetical protein
MTRCWVLMEAQVVLHSTFGLESTRLPWPQCMGPDEQSDFRHSFDDHSNADNDAVCPGRRIWDRGRTRSELILFVYGVDW